MSTPTWGGAQHQPPYPYSSPQYGMQAEAPSHVSPAYTAVQARRGFAPQPYSLHQISNSLPSAEQSSPRSQATSSSPSKEKFPPSCRDYVARAYLGTNTIPGIAREDLDRKLKETIRLSTEEGRLWLDDWENMDLPQVMIQKERALARMTSYNEDFPSLGATPFNGQAGVAMPSRKRKSMENGDENDHALNSTPPWRTANNGNALQDRLSYPAQQSRQQRFQDDSKAHSKFQKSLDKRHKKFDGGYKSSYKSPSPEPNDGPVVGRCQDLEKKYFRLTAAPDPSKVRPLHILEQALDVLKQKWRKEGNYNYICDQFKSMRQDLTVQRIKNEFTVSVYEIHARIALEKGDLGEYNQCQTQLRALYAQGIKGKDVEFKAYRILYFIHTCNRTSLNDVLADLTTAEKREPAIKHALDVRSSLALGNYHRFFRLYLDTPNMGAYLMDMFVNRERLAALSNICRAYKPHVSLRFITEELGFEGDNEAYNFIIEHSPDLLEERNVDGEDVFIFLTSKAGGIFETAKNQAFRKVDLKGQI